MVQEQCRLIIQAQTKVEGGEELLREMQDKIREMCQGHPEISLKIKLISGPAPANEPAKKQQQPAFTSKQQTKGKGKGQTAQTTATTAATGPKIKFPARPKAGENQKTVIKVVKPQLQGAQEKGKGKKGKGKGIKGKGKGKGYNNGKGGKGQQEQTGGFGPPPALPHQKKEAGQAQAGHSGGAQRFEGTLKFFNEKRGYFFVDCPQITATYSCDPVCFPANLPGAQPGDRINFSAVEADGYRNPVCTDIKRMR